MAVVRLKRHFSEEPVDTLLLACKKRKTEDDHLGLTSIFKFAATVSDQKENVSKFLSKELRSSDVKSTYKAPNITNITDRLRAENKLFSQNNRLKVVNCFRTLNEPEHQDGSSEDSVTIVEIESLPLTTNDDVSKPTSEESQKYVYDIYYADDCKLDENMLDNPISCHVLDELVFADSMDEVYVNEEGSDDSNDENNWRNDYPDEDPDSIGEDDMKMACRMNGLRLSETNSLSSDAGEEDLVYGMDDPDFLPEGINGRYYGSGMDYAAYKKRVTQDLDSDASENSDFFYCESDPESDQS